MVVFKIPPKVVSFRTSCPSFLTSSPNLGLKVHSAIVIVGLARIGLIGNGFDCLFPKSNSFTSPSYASLRRAIPGPGGVHVWKLKGTSFQHFVLIVPRKPSVSVGFRRGKTQLDMKKRGLEPREWQIHKYTILSRFTYDKEPSGHTLRCVIRNKWKCVFALCTVVRILIRCNKGLVHKLADRTKGVRTLLFSLNIRVLSEKW